MFSTAEEVLSFIAAENVEFIDVRFCDLPGTIQHFTVPTESFDDKVFTEGRMFDGSSIRGFQQIHESDMLLMPDPTTAVMDPFRQHPTLNITFFVHDPLTGEPYTRDPRNIARKAETFLKGTGIGDTAFFGPEAEFYIFDSVSFDSRTNGSLSARALAKAGTASARPMRSSCRISHARSGAPTSKASLAAMAFEQAARSASAPGQPAWKAIRSSVTAGKPAGMP